MRVDHLGAKPNRIATFTVNEQRYGPPLSAVERVLSAVEVTAEAMLNTLFTLLQEKVEVSS